MKKPPYIFTRHRYFIRDNYGKMVQIVSIICGPCKYSRDKKILKWMQCKFPRPVLEYGSLLAHYQETTYELPILMIEDAIDRHNIQLNDSYQDSSRWD